MLSKANWLRLACLLVAVGWAASASAQQVVWHPLSGDGGIWIGGGLPIPVTKGQTPNPERNHAMKATPNATVIETLGPDPVQMQIRPSKLTVPSVRRYAGQFQNNTHLWMVTTSLDIRWPAKSPGVNTPSAVGTATFKANGRTGGAIYSWCPGTVRPCTGGFVKGVSGVMTYRATKNQFGGPSQISIGGTKAPRIWGRATTFSPAPCTHPAFGGANAGCLAVTGYANPAPLAGQGAPFGYFSSTVAPPVGPLNVKVIKANAQGTIQLPTFAVGVTSNTLFKNNAAGYGGPWTTGQVTIVQKAATPAETFTLAGSDQRVGGVGQISLVSGSLSNRIVSGPNANRGWLNLNVGLLRVTPSLSQWGIATLVLALAGFGAAGMSMRWRKK